MSLGMTTLELKRESDGTLIEVWPSDTVDPSGHEAWLDDFKRMVDDLDQKIEEATMVVLCACDGSSVDLATLETYAVDTLGWRVVASYEGECGAQVLCEKAGS